MDASAEYATDLPQATALMISLALQLGLSIAYDVAWSWRLINPLIKIVGSCTTQNSHCSLFVEVKPLIFSYLLLSISMQDHHRFLMLYT